jgi:virulence factor
MPEMMRIGIFGSGYIAQRAYLPLLTTWPEIEVVGVFSRTAATLEQVSIRWSTLPTFTDNEQLLTRGITAAFVLTPVGSHFDLCHWLLSNGVHVFVEKPPTASSQNTLSLARLAEHKNRMFMVGFNRRFAPLVNQARSQMDASQIRLCIIEKHRPGIQKRGYEETYQEDLIHQVDLLRHFCGELTPIQTVIHQNQKVFISGASLLRTESGALAVILSSRDSGRWQERITIYGADISLELHLFYQLRILQKEKTSLFESRADGSWKDHLDDRGFKGQIHHFFQCIQNMEQPLTNGFDASKSQLLQEKLVEIASG